MKKIKRYAFLVFVLSLVLFTSLSARGGRDFTENEIKNLVSAIQSENEGLKTSAIYFAGYYKLNHTVPIMLECFPKESEKNKVLIALTLYQIGEEGGLTKLMQLSDKERNRRVRNMCKAVMEQYQKDTNQQI